MIGWYYCISFIKAVADGAIYHARALPLTHMALRLSGDYEKIRRRNTDYGVQETDIIVFGKGSE
jgi:hypothetical protein